MTNGIKDYHIKKFSRLVQELDQLREDIQKYNPNVVFRLHDTSSLELGIHDGEGYPYVISEYFDCDAINDVGQESYCTIDKYEELGLHYFKEK